MRDDGDCKAVDVVDERSLGDGPWTAVVTLEGFDLVAKDWGIGVAVVVDCPMVDTCAKVGESVAGEDSEDVGEGGEGLGEVEES